MDQLKTLAAAVLALPEPPERALEIGCGEGDAVLFLAREFPSARVRGVDPSEAAVRAAVARVGLDPEGRIAFKQGGSRALPYPDGLFDLVVCNGGSLRVGEVARVLRHGGHLLYVEPPRTGSRRFLLPWTHWRLAMAGFETTLHKELIGRVAWIGRFVSP
ncbi:MAG TPA: class I SAM-dependent methyltransferase [Solirubrobacterales bacterium]|nr:class I SAM-dependent methyltransferase [Solirubrobacterales bacterium]